MLESANEVAGMYRNTNRFAVRLRAKHREDTIKRAYQPWIAPSCARPLQSDASRPSQTRARLTSDLNQQASGKLKHLFCVLLQPLPPRLRHNTDLAARRGVLRQRLHNPTILQSDTANNDWSKTERGGVGRQRAYKKFSIGNADSSSVFNPSQVNVRCPLPSQS